MSDADVIRALSAMPFRTKGYTPYQVVKWLRAVDGDVDTGDLDMWEDRMELLVQGGALVNVSPRGYENTRVGHYLISPGYETCKYTRNQIGRIEARLEVLNATAKKREEIKSQRLVALQEYMAAKRARERARREARAADGRMTLDEMTLDEMTVELENEPLHVLVIDTETTGLGADDDILQLAVVNGYQRTVHRAYYRPWKDSWPEAEAVHGITPDTVAGCGRVEGDMAGITGMLKQAHVIVGYNVGFDLGFLEDAGLRGHYRVFDVMAAFAEVYGEKADWLPPGDDGEPPYKWQKLATAAEYYGIPWDRVGKAHDAESDARMTLLVLRAMVRDRMRVHNPQEVRL